MCLSTATRCIHRDWRVIINDARYSQAGWVFFLLLLFFWRCRLYRNREEILVYVPRSLCVCACVCGLGQLWLRSRTPLKEEQHAKKKEKNEYADKRLSCACLDIFVLFVWAKCFSWWYIPFLFCKDVLIALRKLFLLFFLLLLHTGSPLLQGVIGEGNSFEVKSLGKRNR